jgi:hypothetical protein
VLTDFMARNRMALPIASQPSASETGCCNVGVTGLVFSSSNVVLLLPKMNISHHQALSCTQKDSINFSVVSQPAHDPLLLLTQGVLMAQVQLPRGECPPCENGEASFLLRALGSCTGTDRGEQCAWDGRQSSDFRSLWRRSEPPALRRAA